MSKSARLVKIIESNEKYSAEVMTALRLQAKAWRLVAIIACADAKKGKSLSMWLMFNTVPFVNEQALVEFIEESRPLAEEAGLKCGIFTERTKP